ncbi:hypothetical protein Noda2021_12660 [Candidatus Dependentiae bacterium Noda2021]|nr:hypothetical protein Noda2021_12660 [Candidatus Dependentiae bacterium Noda2021]
MKKNILLLALFTIISVSAFKTHTMDSLDDNPAFLNKFFAEREEFLQEKTESRATATEAKSVQPVAAKNSMIDSKWCDSKPASQATASNANNSTTQQVFKLWVLSIMLATWFHTISR